MWSEDTIRQLMSSKNCDEILIDYTIELLPEMISLFGKEKTIKFLNEYTFVPRSTIGVNSGATYKSKKKIEFDWTNKNKHEALTLLIHEAGHVIGSLETEKSHFLMEGFKYRDSFLNKLEEAVVSQRQDELEFSDINYTYMTINNLENGEDFHLNDFKTQPSHKYTINKVFYQNLMIILGKNSFLFNKLMYEDNPNIKNDILNRITENLKSILNENELTTLKDCINTFILNYSYHGDKTTIEDYLKNKKNFDNQISEEEYKNLLIQNFPKNMKYAIERNLLSKNIFEAVDELCGITLDVIIRNFSNNEHSNFDNIRNACEYFSKIYNTSKTNSKKTEILKNLLIENIVKVNPTIYYNFIEGGYTREDFVDVFSRIIATNDFKQEYLGKMIYDKEKSIIFVDKLNDFVVNKELIYPDGTIMFGNVVIGNVQPIGYKTELSVINKSDLHYKKY